MLKRKRKRLSVAERHRREIKDALFVTSNELSRLSSIVRSLTDEGQRFALAEMNVNRALNRIEALEIRIGKLFQQRLKTDVRADVIES